MSVLPVCNCPTYMQCPWRPEEVMETSVFNKGPWAAIWVLWTKSGSSAKTAAVSSFLSTQFLHLNWIILSLHRNSFCILDSNFLFSSLLRVCLCVCPSMCVCGGADSVSVLWVGSNSLFSCFCPPLLWLQVSAITCGFWVTFLLQLSFCSWNSNSVMDTEKLTRH